MSHPIVKFAFLFAFTVWILVWLEIHTIVVTTTIAPTGATTTVVDLVYVEEISPEETTSEKTN